MADALSWLQQMLGNQQSQDRDQPPPYQPPAPLPGFERPSYGPQDALTALYNLTGLSDIQAGWQAGQRGEYLQALGQAGYGAASLASLAAPALRGMTGFAPGTSIAAERALASQSSMLYNPKAKLPRPFEADYPAGAASDAAGRLTQDIEGRPLSLSARIVGRQDVGGADVALSPAEAQSIGEGSVGAGYQSGPGRSLRLGSDAGRLVVGRDPATGLPSYQVLINSAYPNQAGRILQHETGHLIDEVAGQIPTSGLNTELRRLYNTLATEQERTRHLTGPENLGYPGDQVPRELMAEAIRAYMADPNSLKTMAPRVAATIRSAVNTNPILSPHIQFNSLAALLAGAGLLGAGQGDAP